MLLLIGGEDEDVVEIDRNLSFGNEISEDTVHYILECGWGVGESKEHYCGLEESFVAFEGGFPFVSFFDADVVVSPSYIKLGEPLLSHKFVNEFLDERERVSVPYGISVYHGVILDWSGLSILFLDEKEG